jgi:hypothetical protein
MAKHFRDKSKFQRRKFRKEVSLPFTKANYYLIASGVLVVVLGFVAMASGGVEDTLPLVVSPILLVIGYCVIIPLGILYRKKELPPAAPIDAGQAKPPAA